MTEQEINETVAKKLGWFGVLSGWMEPSFHKNKIEVKLPDFVNSIQSTWEIVEFIKDHAHNIGLSNYGGAWVCVIEPRAKDTPTIHASALTAPMAICKAFLKFK